MQVLMAEHHGMCFGVRDAIDLALKLTGDRRVTILGDLVHNPDVVASLESAGALRVRDLQDVATTTVLVTAHGTSDRVKLQLREAGKDIHDATCPLVTRAHLALRKLVSEGCFPVVIGRRDHVEVRGLVEDLAEVVVILDEGDIAQLSKRFKDGAGARLGVVSQTTQPLERVRELVEAIERQLPCSEVRFIDTVCQPTKDRQESLRRLIEEAQVIVVVGGPESNNSRKLTELARKAGRAAHQVCSADDLRPEWFDGAKLVGLTAGTSTPDAVIQQVRSRLESF
jgi:4-hydroxy-3-methylbut-2-enyl diphosphate reductase